MTGFPTLCPQPAAGGAWRARRRVPHPAPRRAAAARPRLHRRGGDLRVSGALGLWGSTLVLSRPSTSLSLPAGSSGNAPTRSPGSSPGWRGGSTGWIRRASLRPGASPGPAISAGPACCVRADVGTSPRISRTPPWTPPRTSRRGTGGKGGPARRLWPAAAPTPSRSRAGGCQAAAGAKTHFLSTGSAGIRFSSPGGAGQHVPLNFQSRTASDNGSSPARSRPRLHHASGPRGVRVLVR